MKRYDGNVYRSVIGFIKTSLGALHYPFLWKIYRKLTLKLKITWNYYFNQYLN